MARVPGMQAVNRRLARLGVEFVDLTECEHGCGASTSCMVGRAEREVFVHGLPDPVTAVDALADEVERLRRRARARHR